MGSVSLSIDPDTRHIDHGTTIQEHGVQ